MASTASLNRAFQALAVTVYLDGKPIRAVITREALEALSKSTLEKARAMLDVFHEHQHEIEVQIIDRYLHGRPEPVVIHVPAAAAGVDGRPRAFEERPQA